MNRKTLDSLLSEIKTKHEKHYAELNNMTKSIFLDKKIKFKLTEIVNDETKNSLHDGVIKDVSVTSDCDLMLEVTDTDTKETKIIFSYNVLETEK